MGIGDWFKSLKRPTPVKRPDDVITVYDERGRELQVKRADWVINVLLPNVQQAWDDPRALAKQIVQAIHDDFIPQVAEAADRLVVIDGESEDALVFLAIVRMDDGDLDGAERVLSRSLELHGPTGTVLTNLAKVYDRRDDNAKARAVLRQALGLDPNLDSALGWWSGWARDDQGDAGYIAALQEIAEVPKSWLPQLWLARENLKQGSRNEAMELYEHVLAKAADLPDVLMMVTGDLGNAGALDDLVRLAKPLYQPEVHGPPAGLNLVQALKQLGRLDEARGLVRRLQAMPWPPFAATLAALEKEIASAALQHQSASQSTVAVSDIDRPLWTRGLYEPDWLLPARPGETPLVFIPTFSNELLASDGPKIQASNLQGQLTRCLPLYLAETLGLKLQACCLARMLTVAGVGPAVIGEPLPRQTLERLLPPTGRRLMVAGSLVATGARLRVWEVGDPAPPSTIDVPASLEALGPLLASCEQSLTEALVARGLVRGSGPPALYRSPPVELLDGYALALEQLYFQWLVASEVVRAESLWNERGFFETYFNLVEAWRNPPESARLIAVSGVVAAAMYKSVLAEPYRKIVLHWLDEAPEQSVLNRLAPAVFKRLGEPARLARWFESASAMDDVAYAAWLERVRSAP
jgi:tetratricopeptide (TPR) repeat protein